MGLTKPKHTQLEHKHPVKHRVIVITKTSLRLAAFVSLALFELQLAAGLLAVAELFSLAQELLQ
jgi:hypothetical protein